MARYKRNKQTRRAKKKRQRETSLEQQRVADADKDRQDAAPSGGPKVEVSKSAEKPKQNANPASKKKAATSSPPPRRRKEPKAARKVRSSPERSRASGSRTAVTGNAILRGEKL